MSFKCEMRNFPVVDHQIKHRTAALHSSVTTESTSKNAVSGMENTEISNSVGKEHTSLNAFSFLLDYWNIEDTILAKSDCTASS